MLRDRGLKKWTAMMLPEHVTLLREWKASDSYEKRPIVDEDSLQSCAERINQAWSSRSPLTILCWEHGHKVQHTGVITALNTYKRSLQLDGNTCIDVDTILDVFEVE